MIYIIVLSVIAGALSLYHFFFKKLNRFKTHGIPYKQPIPILGNMGQLIMRRQSIAELTNDFYNLYPEAKYVAMFDIMNEPVVMIRDLELIKSITLKHFDMFQDRRFFVDETQDPLFGKNLFVLRGDKWRQVRQLLSPSFTSSKMKSMFKLMSTCSIDFANYLVQLPPEQKIMQIKEAFSRYTTDVIASCAFGISVDSMKNPENEFYVYGKEASTFNVTGFIKLYITKTLPWFAKLINLKLIRQEVEDFFHNVIKTTIKTRDEKGIVRPDMLQLLMQNRDKEGTLDMSIEDMVAQAFVFFLAFDGTVTFMSFATHEIAVHQDVQKKLQNEIDEVLNATNGQPSYEAINSMEYLDAVINEVLRMYPIAVLFDRLCTEEFELPPALPGLKPFTIKKGEGVWIPIYGFMHDSNYFKEPEKFDPERFCGEQKKATLNSGAYFPFGLGLRMCIGNRFALLETKVLLFYLLGRCDLKTCEKTSIPLKFAKAGFNLSVEGGFWLKVLPRKDIHHTFATINLAN